MLTFGRVVALVAGLLAIQFPQEQLCYYVASRTQESMGSNELKTIIMQNIPWCL